jgi:NADPH:quinone reductase-like Zn-dependent oxidoreductase
VSATVGGEWFDTTPTGYLVDGLDSAIGDRQHGGGVRFEPMSSVNGRVALITGGARGVGAEVARRLHEKGAKLVLTDLDEAPLKELAAELGEDRVLTAIPDLLPRMDAEVAALGRSMSARTEAIEKQ